MYLIQARFGPASATLPESVLRLVHEHARPEDGVEHVSVVGDAPVLGLFITARTVLEAERAADRLCRRLLLHCPEFAKLRQVSCRATLVPYYFNQRL